VAIALAQQSSRLLYRADRIEGGGWNVWRPPAMTDPSSRIVRAGEGDVAMEAEFHRRGLKHVEGGGGLTTQYTELFPEMPIADGTALATFTTEGALIPAPQPYFPPHYWLAGRALRIVARGVLGTTSAPTFTWAARLGTYPAVVGSTALATSAALTGGTTVTNAVWRWTLDLMCRASGASGSIQTCGDIFSPKGFASPFGGTLPDLSATWTATFDTTTALGLWLGVACNTSNSLNTVTMKQLLVLGLN